MKKLCSLFLCALLCVSPLVGCGSKDASNPYANDKKADTENTLDILVLNKGYGIKWLVALADAYSAAHPEVEITIRPESEDATITSMLEQGLAYNKYDLFFTGTDVLNFIKQMLNSSSTMLADLSDVYNAAPNGTAIKDLMEPSLLAAFEKEKGGQKVYYTMPWVQNVSTLLVNNEVMEKAFGENWQTQYPCRTTEELKAAAVALKTKDKTAFIHAADTHYYHFMYEVWWAQYEGLDNVADFYAGRYIDGDGEPAIGPAIFQQEGRLKAVEALDDVLNTNFFAGSNNISWNETQTRFMLGDAAFFPNGDWNNLEMEKSFPDSDIRMLRLPVLSSLGEKYGITETVLREIIDYADGKTQQAPVFTTTKSDKYTTAQIVEAVKEARRITFSYSNYHTVFAASYGRGLSHAKDFLTFMASKEGQKIFAQALNGPTGPYGYDVSQDAAIWNSFNTYAKTRWDIAKNATYYFRRSDLPLGGVGLAPYRMASDAPLEVLLTRSSDKRTPQQIYNADYTYYNGTTAWEDLLRRAGIAI